jgi:hypothetical protein
MWSPVIQFSVIDHSWFDAAGEFFRVATGGLVAATITLYFNGRRHKREEHRAAAQLSARLIDIFERFAIACASIPDDHARNQRESPYDYSGIAGLPKLEELPEDEFGWRALEHQSAIDALTFGTHVDLARDFIRAASEHGDADEVEAAVERKAAELGQKAWQLSCRFRTQYGYNRPILDWISVGISQKSYRDSRRWMQMLRSRQGSFGMSFFQTRKGPLNLFK